MSTPRYAPEARVTIDGAPLPAGMRAALASVSLETGLEGADRVELTLANERLRWLDHPLLRLDHSLTLELGYAPDGLERMFVGEIVAVAPSFPQSGAPTVTVVAQDRLRRLQRGKKVRWFAIPVPMVGQFPLPDLAVGGIVSLEHGLLPIYEPVGAALSILLGGVGAIAAIGDPGAAQKMIRRQPGESDYVFLGRVAAENGWEMTIDHAGPLGGSLLRFFSPLDHLSPDLTLRYGESLVEFSPRLSSVGEILNVSVRLWRPELRMEFTVSVGWDWDRQSLSLSIVPGFGIPGGLATAPNPALARVGRTLPERAAFRARRQAQRLDQRLLTPSTSAGVTLLDEPVTLTTAPRIIIARLLPLLNRRLTGAGSVVGDPRIRAGGVLRLEGLGEQFGGLYRVTSATHTLDGGGYRTSFEVRKEIWFGSIPLPEQGAAPIRLADI